MHARERFARWFHAQGTSREEVATRLGCSGVYVGYLLGGRGPDKRPVGVSLKLAVAIEAATSEWDEGPILASEWLEEPAATGTDG